MASHSPMSTSGRCGAAGLAETHPWRVMCRVNRQRDTQGESSGTEVVVDSFGDFVWLLVWAFVFGCYLVVLFQVLVDLFRDEDLSGWWKAVWVILLIIVPFLSVLIYVIARGRGMADRRQEALGGGADMKRPTC